ncbi:MAG: T9SS type A sorting domain-containing protein [Flavobacteriia bacterium]|nr:T9SS type A sorting domain-containing protein [Flavobacteriia bacterium]
MKKIYLSLLVLGITTLSFAQKQSYSLRGKHSVIESKKEKKETNSTVQNKVDIWSNDFSNANEWTIGTNNGTVDNWIIGTTVPSGQYSIDGIASTTAANGFALFDSDLLCSGNQQAWVQYNNPIDCSAHSTVAIVFEQYYRSFQDSTYVQISVDGVNWTTFEVNSTIGDNDFVANPEITSINISSVAANQATVYVRFYFYSEAGVTGAGGGCGYSWMVDDVKLTSVPDYDLRLTNVLWGAIGNWGVILPYSMIPTSQLSPLYFAGLVQNNGLMTQTDVVFEVNGGSLISADSTINPGETDTLETTTQLNLPATFGMNTVSFSTTSSQTDGNPLDNSLPNQPIEVTQSIYARDMNVPSGGSYNEGYGFEVGNIFDIQSAIDLYSVQFYVSSSTNAGAIVYAKIYQSFDFTEIDVTPEYTIQTSDLGNFVNINFNSPISLEQDSSYLLVVGSFGDDGNTADLVVATSGNSSPQTSFYYDMVDATWYYTTATPMVRMGFEPQTPIITSSDPDFQGCIGGSIILTSSYPAGNTWSTSETTQSITVTTAGTFTVTNNGLTSDAVSVTFVDCTSLGENKSTSLVIYPNPSKGQFTVQSEELTSYSSIELVDALGRTVQTWKINSNTMNIKTKNIESGSYSLIVKGNNGQIIQKVMID